MGDDFTPSVDASEVANRAAAMAKKRSNRERVGAAVAAAAARAEKPDEPARETVTPEVLPASDGDDPWRK